MHIASELNARKAGERGFTLVEVAMSMVIVVLCLLGYLYSNMASQYAEESAFDRTVAIQDANRVVEQMRNVALAGIFPTNVTGAFPDNSAVNGFNNLTNQQVTVSYADASADPLDVTVTVTWQTSGRNLTAALRTFITQRSA